MAASAVRRLGPKVTRAATSTRNLHCGNVSLAGGDWRARYGFSNSPSGYGPMTDLPDWSFADGRPGIPWKGQVRRKQENEAFARRVAMISKEMDYGIQSLAMQQQKQQQAKEAKRQNRLRPKGGTLQHQKHPK
uniref:Large ribosomal subunit protein mL52 n=1 Tax=Sphenodon punctatus TaxID=8508 RepID=A0A8D0G687_SPHPU